MSILLRENWGPPVWRILHTLASKSGEFTNQIQIIDEENAWNHALKHFHELMPCPLCSQHFRTYIIQNSISVIFMKKGYQRKEWLQNFFWNLHNQVNKETNKEEFLKENLEIYNNKEEFQGAWDTFKKMLVVGIEKKQLKADLVKHAVKFLETLKRLYGL